MYRHPAIAEACIISTPDSYRGESVKAVVVLRSTHRDLVTEQDIIDWCRHNMAVYKVPRVVQLPTPCPRAQRVKSCGERCGRQNKEHR